MITTNETELYKKEIGKNYANRVLDYFDSIGFRRPSGEKYTQQEVYNFLGCHWYDKVFHLKVLEAVDYYQTELPKEIAKKSRAIKEKSEAATSDSI